MKRTVIISFMMLIFIFAACDQNKNENSSGEFSGEIIKDAPYDIEMAEIPSGTLKWEADYDRHAMVISLQSFYIGKYVVTQKQWKAVMGNNPSETIGDNYPVTNVSWYDALEFVKKLSEKTGRTYRLPTNEEREYVCRAGTKTDYYFGNDSLLIGEYEWHKGNSDGKLHPVGLKKPNPWGLYDIAGNVCEWTAAYWDPEPFYRKYPNDERKFIDFRIVRSSSYLHGRAAHFRSDYEHSYPEKNKRNYTGFRVVREKNK